MNNAHELFDMEKLRAHARALGLDGPGGREMAYETMEALLCEMQGLRDELADVKRERDALRKEVNISAADVAVLKRLCDALKAERDATNEELEWLRKDSEQGEPQPLRAGEPLAAPHGSRFQWQGDLEDDCTCRVGNLLAHAECLGEIRWKDADDRRYHASHYWFVSVSRVDANGRTDGPDLFHSGEHAGMIFGGEMARAIAEAILSANTQDQP